MLDFRFLIGVILAGIVFVMLALCAFGPVSPLIAAIAERPDLETEAAPRNVLSPGFIRASNAATAPLPLRPPTIGGPVNAVAIPAGPIAPQTVVAVENGFRAGASEIVNSVSPPPRPDVPEIVETVPTVVQLETEEETAKPKRRSIPRKKQSETEDLNPVLLFFARNAKVK